MRLQRIPHDATKYRSNPVELLNISSRNRIGAVADYAVTANTKLLITGAGENNSTTILDSTGKTITRYGDTKISTAQSIIGGSSIYFDGTGDYLSLVDSDDWELGVLYSIDFWYYIVSLNAGDDAYLIGQEDDWNFGLRCISASDYKIRSYPGNSYSGSFSTNPIYNTWQHYALVATAGVCIIYLNGQQVATISRTIPSSANLLKIGSGGAALGNVNGYLSHIRITKGQTLWTSNFTPPKYINNNYIGA